MVYARKSIRRDAALQQYQRSEFHIIQRLFLPPIKYLHIQEQADQGALPIRLTTQCTIAWASLQALQD